MFAFGTPAPKSVDAVLSAFHKTLDELDQVSVEQSAEAQRQQQIADEAAAAAQEAAREAERASTVRAKLRSLLVP